ncbi:MAG TPA: Ig-like domain-containing protein [Polyangiaceae bacterium]
MVLGVLGCDQGPRPLEVAAGPALRLVSSYPENGAGLDCDLSEPECGVPLDASVELRFDRFLLPTSAIRQAVTIRSGNEIVIPRVGPEVEPQYDVFERVVRYSVPDGTPLKPNAVYSVALGIATSEDSFGFRAFDGAPLAGDEPILITFRTGSHSSAPAPSPSPVDCEAVFCTAFGGLEPGCDFPLTTGCAAGGCHGEPRETAAMGLVLAGAEPFERTAVSRVAHGAETGPTTGAVAEAALRFGVAMPLIDPGRPDNSYLLYKLLLAPEAYEPNDDGEDPCTGTRRLAPVDPDTCFAPPADELRRLSEWFVQGEPMPLDVPSSFVRRREIRALQDFILAGASCR